jgi:hypothetical protein
VIGSCAELAAAADALDAELWLAGTVGALQGNAPTGEAFHLAMLDLIDEAERDGRADCLLLVQTMAAVGPQEVAEHAGRAAGRLAGRAARQPEAAVAGPRWVELLGQASAGDCYLWTNAFGEYAQVFATFTHRDSQRRHGLLVTIDLAFHGALAGIDVVTAAKEVDRVAKDMGKDARRGGGRFEPITAADACDRLRAALDAFTDPTLPTLRTGPQHEESLYAGLPLAIRRVQGMPHGQLPPPPRRPVATAWTPQRRQALVEEFFTARPDRWPDPAVARMIAARIVDASIDVLGWPPDRIGPASLARLFGEVLPATLLAPEVILRQAEQVTEAWVEWLTDSQQLPSSAHRKLRRTTFAVLMLFPKLCRDRRVNPNFPYVADLPAEQAGGDALQEVLDRRSFAVPFPGQRGDGLVDLPRPVNGVPAGQTHVDDLDAADPTHRELITAIGQAAHGTHQRRIPAYAGVVEQIWNDEPAAVWQATRQLTATGQPRQRILQRLADAWQRDRPDTPQQPADRPTAGLTDSYTAALHSLGPAPARRR